MARSNAPNPDCCTDPRDLCLNCRAQAAGTITPTEVGNANIDRKALGKAAVLSRKASAATKKAEAGNRESLHTAAADAHYSAAAAWATFDTDDGRQLKRFHDSQGKYHETESLSGDFPDDTDEEDDDDMSANADLDLIANQFRPKEQPPVENEEALLNHVAAEFREADWRNAIDWNGGDESNDSTLDQITANLRKTGFARPVVNFDHEVEPRRRPVANQRPTRYYAGQPAVTVTNAEELVGNKHADLDQLPIDWKEWSASRGSNSFTVNRDRGEPSSAPVTLPTSEEMIFDPIPWKEWSGSNASGAVHASEFAVNNSSGSDADPNDFWKEED